MLLLRVLLVLGLGLHKLVWEALKRRPGISSPIKATSSPNPLVRIVKLLKVGFLAGIVVQALLLPDFPPIMEDPTVLRVIGTVIYATGLVVAIIGRIQLGENWVDLEDYQVTPEQSLVTHGLYGYIRHPIYTGDLLLLTGLELALNSWFGLGVILLFAIVLRQVKAEEAVLTQAFPGYAAYCQRTKMFLPFVL